MVSESAAGPKLRAERAIRDAARAGNGLIAGATVALTPAVTSAGAATTALLRDMLSRMGARLVPSVGGQTECKVDADFRFVDGEAVVPGRGATPADRIAWAAARMPATTTLAGSLAEATHGASAPRVAVSLIVEPKTAAFVLALAAAGCEVALFGAVAETDPEVAAEVAAAGRVRVCAPTAPVADVDAARVDAEHARAVLDWGPDYLIDDGAHLIRLAHTESPHALSGLRGAAEETTSGVRPLRDMVAAGKLKIPVIAVNDARTKTGFDNLIGTGQSCVFAIADALEAAEGACYRGIAGTRWVVYGYGPVGVGVARFASALGAHVTVVEHDPVRALAALHDGCEARRADAALADADVVVSATGVWHTIRLAHLELLRPGAVVAVAGGIDEEIALDELIASGWTREGGDPASRSDSASRLSAGSGSASGPEPAQASDVARWCSPTGDGMIRIVADGGGVNYTAGEGNPIEVMDLSFATQVSALMRLAHDGLAPGIHNISEADERRVAAAALAAHGGDYDDAPVQPRPGGAAQPWTVHRYRRSVH